MNAGVFVGMLAWVLAGLLAAFLAALLGGAAVCRWSTKAAYRALQTCAFAAKVLLLLCVIISAALYVGVVLWFLGF